ncbi:MAG TPA: radical SAM protein [Micromonosporaceae bacterium]|nr:radical SAM protein [Micromonosporaceae bacterium]
MLDLVARLGQTPAGGLVDVPIEDADIPTVTQWCARTGNELVAVSAGVARVRRGRTADPLADIAPDRRPGARLWLYTNFDCNLACDYCCSRSSPKAPRRALGVRDVGRLVAEADAAGVLEMFLTGGEPFLLLDLDEIVATCTARLPTTLLTNGMLFHGRRLDMLRRMPRDRLTLQVSVDSATPDQHDRHRGAGSWRRAMDGVRIAQAEGFRVRVATTVAPGEEADAAALRTLLDGLGIARPDQVVRPVAQRGFASDGVALTVETLLPEITVTADGVYWHPVGVDHPDLLVSRELFPFAAVVATVRERFADYRRTAAAAAELFPCA